VVAGRKVEGSVLASVPSFGVGSLQALWWRARQVRAMLWPLLARSACAQPTSVLAGTKGVGAALASVLLAVVGSDSHCCGEHDR
jgi:hypothetical protein